MNNDQITDIQRNRLAIIYIRQSTSHQVIHHQESNRRQRDFLDRAKELGWARDRIQLIDEDLGQSGSRSGKRLGFEQMVAMAALGKIGIILALEVSRLARSNKDWYKLLDVCSITDTLIADEEGIYNPAAYNDRLLLGLKGTMSEAELYLIKQRLVEATRAKARRGELRRNLPAGFDWMDDRIQKDPDERVRTAIELVFDRFKEMSVIHQVYLSLIEDGIELPVRYGRGNRKEWRRPTYSLLQRMLKNPVYAGAYVYGQRQSKETLDTELKVKKQVKEVGRENWHVLIRDHHDGYISWEEYEKNLKRIKSNSRSDGNPGAPREGEGLLQGLIVCGRCGRRMRIAYGKGSRPTRYSCAQARKQMGSEVCQGFGARRLENAVEKLLLDALSPLGMDAMIEATKLYKEDNKERKKYWEQKVERAKYEVGLARRQYDAVEPENRLVSRELESRFEKALKTLEEVEIEASEHLKEIDKPLTDGEKECLRKFACDLSVLWNASTTKAQDRKRIARCMFENIVVTVPRDGDKLKAIVNWKSGDSTTLEVPKGKTGIHRYVSSSELIDLIKKLAAEFSDDQIARILRRKKLKTPKGLSFMAYHVTNIRYQYGIAQGPRIPLKGENIYTAEQASEILGVSRGTVVSWVEIGLLHGSQLTAGAPWRIIITQEDIEKLKPAHAGEEWFSLKTAAERLKISQHNILQKVKSGELEGVRVQKEKRAEWKIYLPAGIYDNQQSLF